MIRRRKPIPPAARLLAALFAVLGSPLAMGGCSFEPKSMDDEEFWESGYKVLMGGDFGFADTYREGVDSARKSGYDRPLQKLTPFLAAADFSIVNLETPVADLDIKPYRAKKKLVHLGRPWVYKKYLKKYDVNAVGLANNHTMDCGPEGLSQTLKTMDDIGVPRFGAGMNAEEAGRPFVKEIGVGKNRFKLAVFTASEYHGTEESLKRESRFSFGDRPGVYPLWSKQPGGMIKKFRKENTKSFIVVFPHWGLNYEWKHRQQTKIGEVLLDSGADIIIGHGGHLVQEVEKYKNKWIVYSLGNFMFNTSGRYKKKHAWPYSVVSFLRFSFSGSKLNCRFRLYPVFCDNLRTKYQTRPVNEKEFLQVIELLKKRSGKAFPTDLTTGKDKLGRYLEGVVIP